VQSLDVDMYITCPKTSKAPIALADAVGVHIVSMPLTRHGIDGFVASWAAVLTRSGTPAYDILRGGASVVGSTGQALAAEEICRQPGDRCNVTIVIPAGSCSSSAGMLSGLTLLDSPHGAIAVSTNREIDECQDVLLNLIKGVIEPLVGAQFWAEERLTLIDDVDSVIIEDMNDAEAALMPGGIMTGGPYGPATSTVLMRAGWDQTASTVVWLHTGCAVALPQICV
jgi:1-aminocyclopropane-1-carboxylate deaminase/D-cysteine desulfhydrase-like pyridoxal-dependent ACC family enzyme